MKREISILITNSGASWRISIASKRGIVHGNRELNRIYEEKVKKVIERVWEG